jgi:hypothetical protein
VTAIDQRDKALSILNSNLAHLSKVYKECFLSMGRGAMLVYAIDVVDGILPDEHNYRTKREILEVFDAPKSSEQLGKMIDNYNQSKEGIMTLITDYSNATFFVTFKF